MSRRNLLLKLSALGACTMAGGIGFAARAAGSEPELTRGNSLNILNVKDFGAVGDGRTDDTKAIQAAVDATGGSSYGTTGGHIYVPGGTYLIRDTILFRRKSIIFEGAGWGNASTYTTNPGLGTVFVWADGAGNKPMFQIEDSRSQVFRDFRMQGNNNEADRPLAGLRFHHPGSIGHGNNSHLIVENVHIGRYVWTPGELRQGGVDYGILVDGRNANNDQMYFNAVRIIHARKSGIHLTNTQSVWSLYMNCHMSNCGTGFYANCDSTLLNCQFNRNDLDMHFPGTGWNSVFGYQSENAGMLLKMNGPSRVFIDGGYSQLRLIDNPNNPDNLMIDGYPSRTGQMLSIRNHHFRQRREPFPKIRMKPERGDHLRSPITFTLENCHGITVDMLDMVLVDANDQRRIFWRTSGAFFSQFLHGENSRVNQDHWDMDTNLLVNQSLTHQGTEAGFFGAPPVERPVVEGSWNDGTAGRSLAEALAKLGLIENRSS